MTPTSAQMRAARDDLGVFAKMVGRPLTDWQLEACRLATRQTTIVAPRQTGKSWTLSVLAVWWAFRQPNQTVLVISAGDSAAKRLLAEMRAICQHPLLAGSVVDESQTLIVLSNGSTIRSVPASERQIRGWSVDLLIVDEAAFIDEDLLHGAALPTTAGRPDARVVLASSPWSDSGPFFAAAMAGEPETEHFRTVRWRLLDAPWISDAVVEAARAQLSPLRFRAEFEGEFVGSADAYFPADLLRAATCSYGLLEPVDARSARAWAGLDWGRQYDRQAVVLVAELDDGGANVLPQLFVPFWATSDLTYTAQIELIVSLQQAPAVGRDGYQLLEVRSETNGVGAYPTEDLAFKLRAPVLPVASTQKSKEDAYGRTLMLLERRQLILPADPELLRQLGGIVAKPTERGGLSIGAQVASVHDDLADALTLAVSAVPVHVERRERVSTAALTGEWLSTGDGRLVPACPRPPMPVAVDERLLLAVPWTTGSKDPLAAAPWPDDPDAAAAGGSLFANFLGGM